MFVSPTHGASAYPHLQSQRIPCRLHQPESVSLKTGFESLFKGLLAVGDGASVTPFAKGGVVATPSYFPLVRGLGLMGEQGAEAVLPSDPRVGRPARCALRRGRRVEPAGEHHGERRRRGRR